MTKKDKNKNLMGWYTHLTSNYEVRQETYEGRAHIVVPVIMMVEGVHSGSAGPVLHLADELGKIPGSWNGIPVTIQHPEVENDFVPANSPEILASWSVGIVFNTVMDNGALKAEAWIDVLKIQTLSMDAYSDIMAGKILEVSVGAFNEPEEVEGEWNGENYIAIARNHRPDHLALLPGGEGACSVEDGCGVRVYKLLKKGGGTNVPNLEINSNVQRDLNQQGFILTPIVNEMGYTETLDLVRSKLYAMDSEDVYVYMEELFDNSVIYRKEDRNVDQSTLWKQLYQITGGVVEFAGEPKQVKKQVEYLEVSESKLPLRNKFTNNKKEGMADKCTPCVKTKVNALIANTSVNFTEENREWLEGLEETQLDSMTPKEIPKAKAEPVVVNSAQIMDAFRKEVKTPQDFINIAPPGMKEQLNHGLAAYNAQRDGLIKSIMANTAEGTWTEDGLKAMEHTTLQSVYKSIPKDSKSTEPVIDFSLNGNPAPEVNAELEVDGMFPIEIEFEKEED